MLHTLIVSTVQHLVRGNDILYTGRLNKKFSRFLLKFHEVDFPVFDKFAIEKQLLAVIFTDPLFAAVNSHEIHVEQCDAPVGIKITSRSNHIRRVDLLLVEISGGNHKDQGVLQAYS